MTNDREELLRQLASDGIHVAQWSVAEALAILTDANGFCRPPLVGAELREIVEAAGLALYPGPIGRIPIRRFADAFASMQRQNAIKSVAGLHIQGNRRQAVIQALGTELLQGGTPVVEVVDELLEVNHGRCSPPLSHEDIEQIVDYALKDEVQRLHEVGNKAVAP